MSRKKKSNKLLYFLLLTAITLIVGVVIAKKNGWIGKKIITKVTTERVAKRTIIETVSANGRIFPETEVSITPDVSGEIITLTVEEGDSIVKGRLLVRINPDIYESVIARADAAVNSAKANQANAQARLAQVEAQLANARKIYTRNKQLLAEKIVPQVEVDNAEANVKQLAAEVRATLQTIEGAKYNVKSAEASYKEAQDNFEKTNIYAPISGIISKVNVEKGERVVGTSQMSGTEILRIANFNNLEIRVDVSENDVLRVALKDTAIIDIDAYLDRKFKGIVTHIANSASNTGTGLAAATTTDQITNFTVKIRLLHNSYKDLLKAHKFPFRPGMSASVDIQTQKLMDVTSVPIQAVTIREVPDSLKKNKNKDEFKELVFIYEDSLNNQGRVYAQEIKTGIQDESYIQITQGLQIDKEIVVAPYRTISKTLKDNKAVNRVDKEDLYKKEER